MTLELERVDRQLGLDPPLRGQPGVWHPGNSTVKTITGLVPNYTQTYRVYAVDASGNESALSAPLTATTARDVTAPTTPGGLAGDGVDAVERVAGVDALDRPLVVHVRGLMDGIVVATRRSTSTRLRHIAPGTHTFVVRARDNGREPLGVEQRADGDAGRHRRRDAARAAVGPDRASTSSDFCGSEHLSWVASADDVDPAVGDRVRDLPQRRVLRPGAGAGNAFVYARSGTNTWTVVAVDRAGNSSAPSNTVTVTRDRGPEPLLRRFRRVGRVACMAPWKPLRPSASLASTS